MQLFRKYNRTDVKTWKSVFWSDQLLIFAQNLVLFEPYGCMTVFVIDCIIVLF